MSSRLLPGCPTATGPVVCIQPDSASAAAMIDSRNARTTSTVSYPLKRRQPVLRPLWLIKSFRARVLCFPSAVAGRAGSGSYSGADRASHPGAAQPAIAGRILGQILLMVVLGEIELAGGRDLGGDGS